MQRSQKGEILKTGEIYWVNLDPAIGDEIKKRRPVIVVNGGHEKYLRLAIVVPVTAWSLHWDENPFFVLWNLTQTTGYRKNQRSTVFRLGP